jgi:hypothetical protein
MFYAPFLHSLLAEKVMEIKLSQAPWTALEISALTTQGSHLLSCSLISIQLKALGV